MSSRLRRSHYIHFDYKRIITAAGAVTYTLSFNETADFSETLQKQINQIRAETADLSESVQKQVNTNLTETGSISEAITRQVNKDMLEVISITEDMNQSTRFAVAFSEVASFVESFITLFLLGGIFANAHTRRRRRGSQPGGHSI